MRMPGGSIAKGSGGYLQMWNWRATGTTSASCTPLYYRFLDVLHWRVKNRRLATPLTFSGCMGASRNRVVASEWELECSCWYDYNFSPDLFCSNGDTLAIKLTLGGDEQWTGSELSAFKLNGFAGNPTTIANQSRVGLPANGLGLLAAGENYIPNYCSPMAVWTENVTDDSSEGEGIIRMDLKFVGDSLLWYLHSQEEETAYETYVRKLQTANFLASET